METVKLYYENAFLREFDGVVVCTLLVERCRQNRKISVRS